MAGMNALRRIPYRWRYVVVVVVPLAAAAAAYFLVAEWTIWVGIAVATLGTLFVATSHGHWISSVTDSTLEVRGVDIAERVNVHQASEEARLANAINRLADAAVAALDAESANRRYHEMVLDTIDDGILVIEPSGGLLYSNSAAQSMFDFISTDSESGQQPPLTAKVNVIEVSDAASECLRSGSTVRLACTLFNPARHLDIWAAPVDGDDDSVRRALLVIRDKTAEHRLSATLNEFIANASHELRTPITVTQVAVDALNLGGKFTGVEQEFLGRIQASTRKMGVLVDELLDLAIFDTGQTTLHLIPTDVADIAGATCEELRQIAERKGITLDTTQLRHGLIVNADQDKLQRALTNLVTNAVKFSESGDVVELGCELRDGSVAIWVKDEGRGIDPEHLPHVFERFFRTQQSDATEEPGFGLGLSIVKNIVDLLEGTVEVATVLGVGSTFTITLPALRSG